MTFMQARTANEVLKAQERRVRLQRMKGELVDRAKAVAQVFKLARDERDAWVNWPARVAAVIAPELEVDPHHLHPVLEQSTSCAGYRPLWREAMAYVEAHRRAGELVGSDWAAQRIIQCYLGAADAVLLPHGFSAQDMRELVLRPAWILLPSPIGGDRTEQLAAAGVLQAYVTNGVAQPTYTINVHYHTPSGQE
jgi:hypothetical protein